MGQHDEASGSDEQYARWWNEMPFMRSLPWCIGCGTWATKDHLSCVLSDGNAPSVVTRELSEDGGRKIVGDIKSRAKSVSLADV